MVRTELWEKATVKALTEDAIRHYREMGYIARVPAIGAAEAGAVRDRLEAFEARNGGLAGPLRQKSHLLFPWLNDLVRHPGILDPVEDLIGPDILCWGTTFFIKNARDPGFVSWHQDFDLLGTGAARRGDGLGGIVAEQRRERRHAGYPRHPRAGAGAPP